MSEMDLLARRFEADRPHLRAVAQRMLGSAAEADDAVQEAWLRLSRSDVSAVTNLTGWLTTVVSRVCLDMLRSRAARREDVTEAPEAPAGEQIQPEHEALLAEAIGPALLVVLDTLAPGERLALVLHDMFAVPFPEIATIAGCSPAAARQLASRARRKVQGREAEDDRARSRTVVDAFLAASRSGDFAALLALLDPDVVLRADATAVRSGANELVRGASAVAETFCGRARHAALALLDGEAGALWAPGGTPRVAFSFVVADGRVTGIELIADPADLAEMELTPLS